MAECFPILLVSLPCAFSPACLLSFSVAASCLPPVIRLKNRYCRLAKLMSLWFLPLTVPDTYYENAEGAYAGLEFDLASEFARDLGMKVRFKIVPKLDQALSSSGKAYRATLLPV